MSLLTATAMAFREQGRRPLVPILLIVIPAFIVSWSVATTQAKPHRILLPGGDWVTTTMKDLHGPEMAKFSVAVVSALVGTFVMRAALQGDRRLVAAGLRARDAIAARLAVLAAAVAIAVAVSALATSLNFSPVSWAPVIPALLLVGLTYGAIGALAGALLDKLAATYLILFLLLTDLSLVQTPMFHAEPLAYAWLLPGYGPTRLMLDGAFSGGFDAAGPLALALTWLASLSIALCVALRRAVAPRA